MTVSIARSMVSMRHVALPSAALALTTLGAAAWPFTIDDAFIVARYATRITQGLGYTFEPGRPSDGVTGPLWLLPLVLGARLGASPLVLAKWLSLVAGTIALLLVMIRTKRAACGATSSWVAALVGCSSLSLVVWSVAGLETGLAALCATQLALAAVARPAGAGVAAGGWLAALAWLRPELLPFGAALTVMLGLRRPRSAAIAGALGLLGVLTVAVFRYSLFEHWLPLSASAKPPLLGPGAEYVLTALLRPRSLVLVLLVGCALVRGGNACRVLVFALVVHAVAVLLVGGDWMPGRRLFAPVVPTLALALALGLRVFALRRPTLTLSLCAVLAITSVAELVPELTELRRAGARQKRQIPLLSALICRARGPVALIDLGAVSFFCPEQTFVDLGGLTEPVIAHARGAHLDKHIDETWLAERSPGLVMLHSRERPRVDSEHNLRWFAGYPVERRVLGFSWMRNYRVQEIFAYAPAYYYVLLVPRAPAR
jgi:arabinofuranosyltransferase